MAKNGQVRWMEFALDAREAERVIRAARRLGLEVEMLSDPTFRIATASPMDAYRLGQITARRRRASRPRAK